MLKTNLLQHIFIDALPAKVWTVLTSPHYLRQYLFDGDIDCNWTEGSPLMFAGVNGEAGWSRRGTVMQVVPGTLLKYSFQNHGKGEFTSIFELQPTPAGVQLKLECAGCSDSGEEHLLHIQQIKLRLQKIKWLAEYA